MLQSKKKVGVDSNEEQAYMGDDFDEEETDDINLDDEREFHWRMVFEENYGGWKMQRHCYMLRGGINM